MRAYLLAFLAWLVQRREVRLFGLTLGLGLTSGMFVGLVGTLLAIDRTSQYIASSVLGLLVGLLVVTTTYRLEHPHASSAFRRRDRPPRP